MRLVPSKKWVIQTRIHLTHISEWNQVLILHDTNYVLRTTDVLSLMSLVVFWVIFCHCYTFTRSHYDVD